MKQSTTQSKVSNKQKSNVAPINQDDRQKYKKNNRNTPAYQGRKREFGYA